jgi:hypothetical protein
MKIRASTSVNAGQGALHWWTILKQGNDFKGASVNWWCILGLLCAFSSVLLSVSVMGEVADFLWVLLVG